MGVIAQVGEPIVAPNPVDVVNLMGRPYLVDVEPRQLMSLVPSSIQAHDSVALRNDASGDGTDHHSISVTDPPPELSGQRVVRQKFT